MSARRPPGLANTVLRVVLPPPDRESALGDLEEEWRQVAGREGQASADRWYRAQAVRAVGPALRHRGANFAKALAGIPREAVFAGRSLRRRPGLLASSFAALAVGIGSVTAIYVLADAVLLRSPPYTADERLVQVWNTYEDWQGDPTLDAFWDHIALSWPEYEELSAGVSSIDALGLHTVFPQTLTDGGDPDQVMVGLVSSTLFPMLSVSPVLGRVFAEREDGPGAPRLAMLSYDAWVGRFGAERAVIGRPVSLSGVPFEIVGVLPADFELQAIEYPIAERPAVWIPVGGLGEEMDRGNHSYEAIARLAEGVGIEAARDEIAAVIAAGSTRGDQNVRLEPRRSEEIGDRGRVVLPLSVGSAVLLLIACGNFAILLLGDTLRRRRELATRAALGAGAGRLMGQLAVEGGLLGIAGAVGGMVFAQVGVWTIMWFAPEGLTGIEARPDLSALGLALLLGAGTGVVVAALSAVGVGRRTQGSDLGDRSGIGGGSSGGAGRRSQGILLSAQVAFSVVLLVTAGLLARSSYALSSVDPGFSPDGLVSTRIDLPGTRYSQAEATQFYIELIGSLTAEPGIEAASMTSAVPFSNRGSASSFRIVGRVTDPDDPGPQGQRRTVLPGFHRLMGIPLLAGRLLSDVDRIEEAPVVLVSETLADLYWPEEDAVGSRIARDGREWEVVGVVGDALHADLSAPAQPTFYVPFEVAEDRNSMNVVIRSAMPLDAVGAAVRRQVWAIDAELPVEDLATVSALVARSAGEERFRSVLIGLFALAATVLCATGLFGITSRFVTGRRREIGVQLALGAQRGTLAGRVALSGGRPVVIGLLLGILGAVVAATGLSSVLFGVEPLDPGSFLMAVGLLAVASAGAAFAASWRGTRLDPAEAIRAE